MTDSEEKGSSAVLAEAIEDFSTNTSALRDFVALIGPFLEEHSREVVELREPQLETFRQALNKALSDQRESLGENLGQSVSFTIRLRGQISEEAIPEEKSLFLEMADSDMLAFELAMHELSKTKFQEELLYKSSLMSLISSAEWFLSQILHHYFQKYPEATGQNTKSLSLEDLKSLGSVDDAIRFSVDSKVDEVMRGSFEDWVKYFRETIKLGMGYIDICQEELIEIYQRRNLLVHNGGRVNSVYMSKVDASLKGEIAMGERISVSREYLERAINLFELNFILIAAELWKKLDPTDPVRGAIIGNTALGHIKNARYEIAAGLAYFGINDKQLSENTRMIDQMNYWQCKKWSECFEEVREEVENVDLSAKSLNFQLARLALLDRYEDFFGLLPAAILSNGLTYDELHTRPIFQGVRDDHRYASYCEEHAAEFSKAGVEISATKTDDGNEPAEWEIPC